MSRSRFTALLCLCAALCFAYSQAALAELAPAGFTPNTEVQLVYDTNPRRATGAFESSDWALIIKPDLPFVWRVGKHQFDLGYKGGWALYEDDSDLNYKDHHFYGHMLLDHSFRLTTEFDIGHKRSHEDPGSTDALAIIEGDLNEYEATYGRAEIRYGRSDSIGELIGSVGIEDKDFTNNEQDFRDRQRNDVSATFFYRVQPNTRILTQINYIDRDFDNETLPGIKESSTEMEYLLGVQWKATYQTMGLLKVGYRQKDYDDSFFEDIDGLALSAEGQWKPNTFTKVKLTAELRSQDSAVRGSQGYEAARISTNINHGLTPRLNLTADLGYGLDDYDSGGSPREDKLYLARVGLGYSLTRWLDVGTELRYEEVDSNIDVFEYDSKMFLVTAKTLFD